MAGGGRRRGGGSEEGEDDDDFSDAHALSAQDINVRLSLPSLSSTHSSRRYAHKQPKRVLPPSPSALPLTIPPLCPLWQSLCDKLLKAQEESLHWRGRCMQLEALQILPLAPLRPPQPPAPASPLDAPPSLNTAQEVGPSGVAANARQPPSPTAAAGGAGNALGRPPRPEALQVYVTVMSLSNGQSVRGEASRAGSVRCRGREVDEEH
jgi:hypothetical protein